MRSKGTRRFLQKLGKRVALWCGCLLLVACGPADMDAVVQKSIEPKQVAMVIYGSTGNPFWSKVMAGAEEAARHLSIDVAIQFAGSDPVQMNNIIEAAIVNRVAGIGIVLDQEGAYDKNIARAKARGIPVVAFNIDSKLDSSQGAANGRDAFVGQDFTVAGYAIAKRLIREVGIAKGDRLVCPVEHPEASYATLRYRGVQHALDEVGAHCEVLSTGSIGIENTITKLTQYLVGKPQTTAVVSLGGLPTEAAPTAIAEAGLAIPNVGFDLSKTIIRNILDGKTLAVVDQQPFYQGYFTVVQLYFASLYGLRPVDINTGAAVIDSANAPMALEYSDTVR